jgi:tetratricopeptide (TPR) repeat protein
MMPLVRAQALEALKLDPADGDARALLCAVAAAYDYDWKEAELQFQATRTGRLPRYARRSFPLYLLPLGRVAEAVQELRRGLEQDPLDPLYRVILAYALYVSGHYERAVDEAQKALEMDDGHWFGHMLLAWFHGAQGLLNKALPAAKRAYELAPWHARVVGVFAGLLARTGEVEQAEELVRRFTAAPTPPGASMGMVMYHLMSLNRDAAADWFEKAIEQRETLAPLYLRDPLADGVRSSARGPKLAAMLNLADPAPDPAVARGVHVQLEVATADTFPNVPSKARPE